MFNEFLNFLQIVLNYAIIVQTLIISTAVVMILSPYKRSIKSLLFTLLKIVVFCVAELFMAAFFGMLARYVPFFMGNNFLFGYIIGVAIYAMFFCKYKRRTKWMMASSILAVSLMTLEIGAAFSMLLESSMQSVTGVDWMGMGKCLFMTLVVGFAILQMVFSMRDYATVPPVTFWLVVGSNIFTSALNFIYEAIFAGMGRPDNDRLIFAGIFFVTLYLVNLASYMLTYFLCKEREAVVILQGEKRQAELNAEMMRMSEKNLEYLRQLKHDIGNQYAYASVLMENGQYEEAKKFFKEMGDSAVVPLFYVDSGNKSIDAILNMELSKANSHDIKTDISVVVPPHLPFSDNALCSIISNLVDNAIEALIRYDLAEKCIKVVIHPRTDYLYILVENPLPPDVDKAALLKLHTSKRDDANHGIGTQIVKRLVEEYNGYITYQIEEDKFFAEVMISIIDDKAKTADYNEGGVTL